MYTYTHSLYIYAYHSIIKHVIVLILHVVTPAYDVVDNPLRLSLSVEHRDHLVIEVQALTQHPGECSQVEEVQEDCYRCTGSSVVHQIYTGYVKHLGQTQSHHQIHVDILTLRLQVTKQKRETHLEARIKIIYLHIYGKCNHNCKLIVRIYMYIFTCTKCKTKIHYRNTKHWKRRLQ